MWSLKNLTTLERHFFIIGREYTVGRKDNDILILEDMSISRKHAVVRISHSERNLSDGEKTSELVLKDISKLGTQLPGKRISNGDEEVLRSGNIISFGTSSNNNFEVVCEPLVVTASCLPGPSKKNLKKLLFKLGGSLLNEWSQKCSHVVMLNLSLTVKVACALLSQKPIVTPAYFEEVLKSIESSDNGDILPTCNFLPVMAESQLNPSEVSFAPLPQRSSVFKGKIFVFLLSEQLNRLKPVVELGSGVVKFMDVAKSDFKMNASVKECLMESCVILPESNENSIQHQDKIQLVILYLNKSHRRLIPESEAGFAILYCSTQQYCNPLKKSHQPPISHYCSTSHQTETTIYHEDEMNLNQLPPETNLISDKSKENVEIVEKNPLKCESNKMANVLDTLTDVDMKGVGGMDESSCNLFPGDSELVKVKESHTKKNHTMLDNTENDNQHLDLKRKYLPENEDSTRPVKIIKTAVMDERVDERMKEMSVNDYEADPASQQSTTLATKHQLPKHSSNHQTPSQMVGCLNTREIDSKYLDMSFEPLKTVEGKCCVVEENLELKKSNAMLVEWKGQMVPNYKRFVKILSGNKSVMTTSFTICGDDLYIQPSRNLSEVALKMD